MSGQWFSLNSPWRRFCFATTLFCVATATSVWADGLVTPIQRLRAQNLYPQFTAPCCWRQSVAVHQSAQAIHVRAEIDEGIIAGKNDDQIKTKLIREYGHGILMEPEGVRAIIAYAGPILALAIGFLAFLKWVKTNVKPSETGDSALHPITADVPNK
jgi:cytochrome c-type biogenesis protein CcmH/NrfF